MQQHQVNNLKNKKRNEKLAQLNKLTEVYFERESLMDSEKKYSCTTFTKFGKIKLAQNTVSLSLFKQINDLYLSVLEAKKVMLQYKSELATVETVDNNSITPLAESKNLPMVFYKREDLTTIKAYKIRGALYQMKKFIDKYHNADISFVAASTGNHALGVLKAAEILNVSGVTIFVPENVTDFKKHKLEKRVFELSKKGIKAKLIVKGKCFEETNALAKDVSTNNKHCFYVDPYNTHNAVAGQGTIGLELLSQLNTIKAKHPDINKVSVISPIGGGGLISGIACALKTGIKYYPKLKDITLNVIGVRLKDLTSKYGDAIKVKVAGKNNQEYINKLVDKQVIINDDDMKKCMDYIYEDIDAHVEGASSGTLASVMNSIVTPSKAHAVICVLSGGNV